MVLLRNHRSQHGGFYALLSYSLTAFVAGGAVGAQCTAGAWFTPFNHSGTAKICGGQTWPTGSVNALHMSLIPKGDRQGWTLIWDHAHYSGPPAGKTRVHRWALVNPTTGACENYCMLLPTGKGDLFCAGHAWNAAGNLLVAGGTGCHGGTTGCTSSFGGSKLTYVWEPPGGSVPAGGTWHRVLPDLDTERWYPSVVALGPAPDNDEDRMLVGGGTHLSADVNSYQVWRPTSTAGSWQTGSTGNTFAGPTTNLHQLGDYPRLHLMSALGNANMTGRVITAGHKSGTARVDHYGSPGSWPLQWSQSAWREYGSSVSLAIGPNGSVKDWVLSVGGKSNGSILALAELTNGGLAGVGTWTAVKPLTYSRWFHNTVLLPDGRVFAIGGERGYTGYGCSEIPALVPELYDATLNLWLPMAAHSIIRDYHSTALLLPDATVLCGGGEYRGRNPSSNCRTSSGSPAPGPWDYQRWNPYYLQCGNPRPVITNGAAAGSALAWGHGQAHLVTHQALTFPTTIAKVCLVRPGSVTPHADTNQRCVDLDFVFIPDTLPPTPGYQPTIQVTIPSKNSGLLPRGYYMLFLMTNLGVPSLATWVKVS